NGIRDTLDPGSELPIAVALPIDFNAGLQLRVSGSLTGNLAGTNLAGAALPVNNVFFKTDTVQLNGSAQFALTRQSVDVDTDGNGSNDLPGATLDGLALSVTDVGVVVPGVAEVTVSGALALARITPADLGFEIREPFDDNPAHAGQLITYSVKPILGIPLTWVTRIDDVQAPHRFVDTQLRGPYKR
ncbi:MAG: hypothetical protein JNM07_15355, partial [Phycisphaerae bacterium]|nr:hypothetical protein [Phycisphaerae bacterium]